jgi:calcineurin-like phosphoesterase family protein
MMNNIWFTSDTHFGHKNICRGTTVWKDGFRDFDCPAEMNEIIIENINNFVKENDTLYHLGDWSMGNPFFNIIEVRKRINCKTIHLILGNHDPFIRKNKMNCKDLFSSVRDMAVEIINNKPITMCHYPMHTWGARHRGKSWHLHGHTHGHMNGTEYYNDKRALDVGIDTHPEFRPYSFDEVRESIMLNMNNSNKGC